MNGRNGVNIDLVRAMYAAKYQEQQDEIERLTVRVATLQTALAAANDQIAEYKNVVFKTQMKLDAANARE